MDWQALRGPQLTPRGTEGSGGSLLSPTQPLGACRWRGARLSVPLAWFKIRKARQFPWIPPAVSRRGAAGIIHMRQVSTAQRQGPGSRGQRRCRTRLPPPHTVWPVAGPGTCAGRNCGWGRRVPARGHWEPRPQWRGTATQHSRSGGGTLVLRAGLSRRSGNAPIQPSTITAVNRYPPPEPVTVRGARGLSCINPAGTRSSQDEGLPSGHPTPGPELLCSPQL